MGVCQRSLASCSRELPVICLVVVCAHTRYENALFVRLMGRSPSHITLECADSRTLRRLERRLERNVLKAMAVPHEYAIGTLRLSTGRHTTEEEVRTAAALIIAEATRQWE